MAQIIERNPAVVARQEEGGESVLFNTETENAYVANKSAVLIWELCQGRSRESVQDEIRRQYAVDDETAEKITAFLDFLAEKELITLSDNGNNQPRGGEDGRTEDRKTAGRTGGRGGTVLAQQSVHLHHRPVQ